METPNNTKFSITSDYDNIDWEKILPELLPVLMAYTYSLIGDSNLRLRKNRADLAYDFSMDAIKAYIENPSKFDPSRNNDLVNYLKFSLIRRIVSNFKKLKGQQNEIILNDDTTIDLVAKYFIDGNEVEQIIDYEKLLSSIEIALAKHPDLLEIFRLRIKLDYKKSEVCTELKISTDEYSNRFRRMRTVARRIIKIAKR
jgi:hypothetical protein